MPEMKALTLHQPWATLVAVEAKRYETRSWGTNYRGPLAIHAAKTKEHQNLGYVDPFYHELQRAAQSARWLPYGAIVAVCKLESVAQIYRDTVLKQSARERQFGDYSQGRYIWELTHLERLGIPIEVRGRQGLWTWDFSDRPDYQVAWLAAYISSLERG